MTPGKINHLLRTAAGEGNDLIYRFLQAAAIAVSAMCVFVVLALLWLTSWLWCSVPCLTVLFGVALLLVGGRIVERSRMVGGGVAGAGLVLVLLGVPLTGLNISSSMAKHREQREIRHANQQVASIVDIAQGHFAKGDLDEAEKELQQVALVTKATEIRAAAALQEKIRRAQQEAAIRKANWEVSEHVREAEMDFSSDRLEAAEERLAAALRVQNATDTGKAKELLSKIPVRRQELANQKVAKLMEDAMESFRADQFDKVLQIIDEAIAVKGATNNGGAEKLLAEMSYTQPELFFRDAMRAIGQREYPVAAKRLKAYLAHSSSGKKAEAERMLGLVELVTDGSKAQASVKSMSDAQIELLSKEGKLPDGMATTDAALAQAVKAALTGYASKERNRRQAELAERKRQEEAMLAEEAAARQKAEAEAAREAKAKQNLNQFVERMKAVQKAAGIDLVSRVSVEGNEATITVANVWHGLLYQTRLQLAQGIWGAWASIASPGDPDKARIRLVDFNGNEVGGSRWLAGSLIWVQE